MTYDVVIVGGGPGGLAAALALGRARKRVLLSDGGPRRNALAVHVQNFLTRDGTPPAELRRIGREQLGRYPNVEVRDAVVGAVTGARGAFRVEVGAEVIGARRVLLSTGMIDEMLPIKGFRELWGRSIFQCPYCHGWESQDRRWGHLVRPTDAGHFLMFALQAGGWTRELTVFTNGALDVPEESRTRLDAAGIRLEEGSIARLVEKDGELSEVELSNGSRVPCDVLFSHPPQRQVDLVRELGVALDGDGFVLVDPMKRETSVPGIFAAGDLTTRMQAAIVAAAAGMQAAAMINVELAMEPPSAR